MKKKKTATWIVYHKLIIVFTWTEYNKTQAGMYPTGILFHFILLKKTKKKKHCKQHGEQYITLKELKED